MRALVTGGAQRLGRAMALYLADRGFDVVIHYNSSEQAANDLVSSIMSKGRKASSLAADILDEGQVTAIIERAQNALGGPLSVLVNNASIFEYDNLRDASRTSWDRHIESNLRAPFVLTQAFAEQARKNIKDDCNEALASSLIVNMIDQRVRKLTPEFSSYTIAKMGLWALTQISAQSLAPDIRVNAIGPGPTLQGYRQSDDHFKKQRRSTVLERGANPSDITAALGYFLDADAVTGQLICVDGGQHLCWQTPDVLGVE